MFPVFPFCLSISHFICHVGCNILQENVIQPTVKAFNDHCVPLLEPVVLESVFLFQRLKIRSMLNIRRWRKEYVAANAFCNAAELVGRSLFYAWLLLTREYVESEDDVWISVFTQNSPLQSCKSVLYSSKYGWPELGPLKKQFSSDETFTTKTLLHEFSNKYASVHAQHVATETPCCHVLMVGKFGKHVHIVRNVTAQFPLRAIASHMTSGVDFLAVEYTPFPGATPLQMDVPYSHYIVGNELFSRAYIYRYLKFLPRYTAWEFTEDYTIKIIDDNLQETVLRCGQCIVLEEESYKVIHIENDAPVLSLEHPGLKSIKEEDEEYEEDDTHEHKKNSKPQELLPYDDEWEKIGDSP